MKIRIEIYVVMYLGSIDNLVLLFVYTSFYGLKRLEFDIYEE